MKSLLASLLLVVSLPLSAASNRVYGDVHFENSGSAEAQDAFQAAVAMLHNFQYEDAADSFRAAQKIDPSFTMAYWGEAMTFNHGIWLTQDRDAGRAVLAKAPEAKTERERAYIDALRVLYGEGDKRQRDAKYSDAMAALHEKYPNDVDATAFYALSLLAMTADDRDEAAYMRAAAMLEEVFPTHQRHPGVLHYLIHAYDDPVHAPLGIRAARLYSSVAPDSAHALHMTSHIFVAMGMWNEVIQANIASVDALNRRRAEHGQPPAPCGHAQSWLHYGYLQTGRFDDAQKALDACRAAAAVEKYTRTRPPFESDDSNVTSYASMRAQEIASGASVAGAAFVVPEGPFAAAKLTLAYGDGLAAFARNDAQALADAAQRVREQAAATADLLKAHGVGEALRNARPQVMAAQVAALQLIASGKRNEGIDALRKVATAEAAMPFAFGPPSIEKPSLELLGEQLLAAGRPGEAEDAFRRQLLRTPGRTRTLEGLRAAQKTSGTRLAPR